MAIRTQDEIVAHMKSNRGDDFLGFRAEALIRYLDFAHAKEFLKPEASQEDWEKDRPTLDESAVRAQLAEYMAFAWGKVEDHRGISASRSVEKCSEWVWLLGDEETLLQIEKADYAQYGAPKLAVICKRFELPIPSDSSVQRMIRGEPCYDGCDEGCGR